MCLLPINYASRPHLRGRLTLSRRTELRKPWTFGEEDSHFLCRYLCLHVLFRTLQRASRHAFTAYGMLPYRPASGAHSFGEILSPDYFRRTVARPVSYYALFE